VVEDIYYSIYSVSSRGLGGLLIGLLVSGLRGGVPGGLLVQGLLAGEMAGSKSMKSLLNRVHYLGDLARETSEFVGNECLDIVIRRRDRHPELMAFSDTEYYTLTSDGALASRCNRALYRCFKAVAREREKAPTRGV
jgi:hypothetical protein